MAKPVKTVRKSINYTNLVLWVLFGVLMVPVGLIAGAVSGAWSVLVRAHEDIFTHTTSHTTEKEINELLK